MVERNPEISVVVPLLNEQDNIGPLYEQITQTLSPDFVDDGSTDKSFDVMAELQKADDRVRIIRFRKNFGQTAALSAGFDHARGEIVVAMDGDLQNDPADIPMMLAKLDEGYDVVSGWRKKRHDNAVTRLLPSKAANWLISRLTGVKLHDYGCTLKAYRREVLAQMQLYGEMHRFIPAMASWSGAAIAEMVVNHRPRTAGVAKYGLGRIRKVVLDLITVKFLGSFWRTRDDQRSRLDPARPDGDLPESQLQDRHERQPAAAADGPAVYRCDPVHPDGSACRASGANLSRIAGPPDVRHQGNHRIIPKRG